MHRTPPSHCECLSRSVNLGSLGRSSSFSGSLMCARTQHSPAGEGFRCSQARAWLRQPQHLNAYVFLPPCPSRDFNAMLPRVRPSDIPSPDSQFGCEQLRGSKFSVPFPFPLHFVRQYPEPIPASCQMGPLNLRLGWRSLFGVALTAILESWRAISSFDLPMLIY